MLTDYLFLLLTFPIASVLHGGDYVPKGWLMAGHALLSLAAGWFAPLGVAAYWLFFRRGKQAQPELDALPPRRYSIDPVKEAYPLWLGYVIAPAIKGFESRREQEFVGSLIVGVPLALFALL